MDNESCIERTTIDPFGLKYSLEMTIALSLAYLLVFLAGIFGNITIFLTVRKSRRVRRLTVIFILNLAAADLLVLFFCLPFTLAANIFSDKRLSLKSVCCCFALFIGWIFGPVCCKLVSYFQGVSVSASVNTMMFVAVDRYMAISSPLAPTKPTRYYLKAVFMVWSIALALNLPWLFVFELEPVYEGSNILVCNENWSSPLHGILYFTIVNVLIFYLAPLVVISTCYILIWRIVGQRHVPGEYNNQQSVNNSQIKVEKMVLVVILTFAVLWFPLYCVFAIIKFDEDLLLNENVRTIVSIIIPIAQWMGAANSCINPLLFVHMDRNFQTTLTKMVRRYIAFGCCNSENQTILHNYSSRGNNCKSRDHLQNSFFETKV